MAKKNKQKKQYSDNTAFSKEEWYGGGRRKRRMNKKNKKYKAQVKLQHRDIQIKANVDERLEPIDDIKALSNVPEIDE